MERKSIVLFVCICFALTVSVTGLFVLAGGDYSSLWGTALASGIMLIPMVSVLLTQMLTGERLFQGCGVSFKFNSWWVIAVLAMPVLSVLAMLASTFLPGVSFSTDTEILRTQMEALAAQGQAMTPVMLLVISLISAVFAGATINAVLAFGEEVAWRGFLLEKMKGFGFWKKSVIIGIIWGLWHAPVILLGHNYPDHPVLGVLLMTVFCTLLSPVLVFVREKSSSVIAPAMAHGAINASAGISLLYLAGYSDILCGLSGLAGMAVILAVDIAIAVFYRQK